jgi:hypothetical protein
VKKKPITLHSWIDKLRAKHPDLAESLMALKWLDDTFDGLDC